MKEFIRLENEWLIPEQEKKVNTKIKILSAALIVMALIQLCLGLYTIDHFKYCSCINCSCEE